MEMTTDHDVIRSWVEERGGMPVIRRADATIDISFADEDGILEMSWDDFFDLFDAEGVFFEYDEDASDDQAEDAFSFLVPLSATRRKKYR